MTRSSTTWRLLLAGALTWTVSGVCRADATAPLPEANAAAVRLESLAIYPPEISLSRADDYQGVIAVATRADGVVISGPLLASDASTSARLT